MDFDRWKAMSNEADYRAKFEDVCRDANSLQTKLEASTTEVTKLKKQNDHLRELLKELL